MAADPSPVPLELLQRTLTGKRLPGADLAIADYENTIATRALRGEPGHNELAHSIWFIICSLRGMGVTVNELRDLAHAGPHDTLLYGEVTIEQQLPLRVGERYRSEAVISDVGRSTMRDGSTLDKVAVLVELFCAGIRHGAISSTYLFKRGSSLTGRRAPQRPVVGDQLPELRIEAIDVRDIIVMALILCDPNPIHYDIDAVRAAGLGEIEVNQGGSTMAYLLNMLTSWTGSEANLCSIRSRFSANVVAGDTVTAKGTVTAVTPDDHSPEVVIVECDVWAERDDGVRAVTGSARVRYPLAGTDRSQV